MLGAVSQALQARMAHMLMRFWTWETCLKSSLSIVPRQSELGSWCSISAPGSKKMNKTMGVGGVLRGPSWMAHVSFDHICNIFAYICSLSGGHSKDHSSVVASSPYEHEWSPAAISGPSLNDHRGWPAVTILQIPSRWRLTTSVSAALIGNNPWLLVISRYQINPGFLGPSQVHIGWFLINRVFWDLPTHPFHWPNISPSSAPPSFQSLIEVMACMQAIQV